MGLCSAVDLESILYVRPLIPGLETMGMVVIQARELAFE